MRRYPILATLVIGLLCPALALAKGDGIAFSMQGKVTHVTVNDQGIQFEMEGTFCITQSHDNGQHVTELNIECKPGTSITVSQADPFFAMTTDWHGGAIRPAGTLATILQAAEQRGNVVKFELLNANISFAQNGVFKLLGAQVIRATDADLR